MTTLATNGSTSARSRVFTILAVWIAAAFAFSLSGMITRLPVFAVPAMIWGTTLGMLAVVWRSPGIRRYLSRADLRPAVLYHAIRAPIGVVFFWLGSRGELHPAFVSIAGWGDIVAGVGAVIAFWMLSTRARSARTTLLAWNVIALLDILIVFVTAQRIILFGGGFDAMIGLTRFPLSTIPLLIVPLVLLTHLWIFVRLRAGTALER